VAGGALALAGAMAYAELGALRPNAGGEYVYLRAAYGRLAGFLTGWTSFVAGFSGAIAASSVVLTSYLGRFVNLNASAGTPTARRLAGPRAPRPPRGVRLVEETRAVEGRVRIVVPEGSIFTLTTLRSH
jgi:amino acid transporter